MDLYEVTSPAPRERWEWLAKTDDTTMIFQTPSWIDGACGTGIYENASRLYQTRDGHTLLLPLVRRKNIVPGLSTLASLPSGWGSGGPIADNPIRVGDIEMILDDLARQPAFQASIRPNPLTARVWDTVRKSGFAGEVHHTHILDLEGGFDQIWEKRFSSSTRTKIRKAEKSGITVECGTGEELVPEFYSVYMKWIDRRARERHVPGPVARWLGKHREPLVKFESAARALGPAFQILVAYKDSQPIAAAAFLVYGKNANYWRGASIKELAGPVRANDLLQMRMIQAACQAGCRYYHLGESGGVKSLRQFKAGFGAEELAYTTCYRETLPLTSARSWFSAMTHLVEQRSIKKI